MMAYTQSPAEAQPQPVSPRWWLTGGSRVALWPLEAVGQCAWLAGMAHAQLLPSDQARIRPSSTLWLGRYVAALLPGHAQRQAGSQRSGLPSLAAVSPWAPALLVSIAVPPLPRCPHREAALPCSAAACRARTASLSRMPALYWTGDSGAPARLCLQPDQLGSELPLPRCRWARASA